MGYNHEQCLLPEDVIIEILSRLPSEALVKFRSVCRSWYSKISDAKFIDKHESYVGKKLVIVTPTNSDSSSLLLQNSDSSFLLLQVCLLRESNPGIILQDMYLKFPKSSFSVYGNHIVGSCNGFLCCAASLLDDASIQLCNPYCRWAQFLPPYRLDNGSVLDANFGVGFDRFSKDSKVVKFNRSKTAIYSVNDMSWKIISARPPLDTWYSSQVSVFLRGFIHWIAYKLPIWKRAIISYDVCNDVFGEIQLPEIDKCYDHNPSSIYVVRGRYAFWLKNSEEILIKVIKEFVIYGP